MFRPLIFVLVILAAASSAAEGACPPEVPGDAPEAIRANGERIVCLQDELASATRARGLELQLDALERSLQDLRIQQRMETLPKVPIYVPPPPAAPRL